MQPSIELPTHPIGQARSGEPTGGPGAFMTPQTSEMITALGLGFDADAGAREAVLGQAIGQFVGKCFREKRGGVDAVDRRVKLGRHHHIGGRSTRRNRSFVETSGKAPRAFTEWTEARRNVEKGHRGQGAQRTNAQALEKVDEIDQCKRIGIVGTAR